MTGQLTARGRDRLAAGRRLRRGVPRSDHADWTPSAGRDPVATVLADEEDRLESLIPERHRRMTLSPFTFFRATAGLMAADLAPTPITGLTVQACGDAHVSNFGTFATPERHQAFDVNDFDETLPAPWEWDLKRLTTSLVLAARDNGYTTGAAERAVRETADQYARAMNRLAHSDALALWYTRVDLARLEGRARSARARKQVSTLREQARRRTGEAAARKFTEVVDGERRIRSRPPFLLPLRDVTDLLDVQVTQDLLQHVYDGYLLTLSEERRWLLGRYHPVDLALKVVGVGSVGTRCFILLMVEHDHGTPLLLQIKEAGTSVLEAYAGPSRYTHAGERVVRGQRTIQAASDILLGWTTSDAVRDFYVRQLRDMKGSIDLSTLSPGMLRRYGRLCASTLAMAHARSGDRLALAGYVGRGRALGRALARFSTTYADQVALDHAAFLSEVGPSEAGPGR